MGWEKGAVETPDGLRGWKEAPVLKWARTKTIPRGLLQSLSAPGNLSPPGHAYPPTSRFSLCPEKPEPTPPLTESGPARFLPDGRSLGAHVTAAWSALREHYPEAGCRSPVWEALLRGRAAAQPWAYRGRSSRCGGSSTENCVMYLSGHKASSFGSTGLCNRGRRFCQGRKTESPVRVPERRERGQKPSLAGTHFAALTFNNSNNRATFSPRVFSPVLAH